MSAHDLNKLDFSGIKAFVRQAIGERCNKLAIRDTWPELFGDWNDDKLAESTSEDMEKIIKHHLLYGVGFKEPMNVVVARKLAARPPNKPKEIR